MNIGLYFGTFNPIHMGHLVIANYMAHHQDLDAVWLVVSPQNPLKQIEGLLPDHHRLQMVHLAIRENEKLEVCDAEFDLPRPSYTIHTLNHLKEKHPNHHFHLIMGEDNLRLINRWKDYEIILKKFPVLVYPRAKAEGEETFEPALPDFLSEARVTICHDAPLLLISSTFIRNAISNRKDIRYLIPEAVTNYISNNFLYED